jgi:vacuolar protein sorting-associated protein 13D
VEQLSDLHYKQAFLDLIEARWRTQNEDNSYYASSYSGWMSYGTSLITNIVENLQLNIKDVHIRYEDQITIPERHFCCGLTIESLTAQSCDSNFVPGFTANWATQQATFKIVELNSFSFYLDPLLPDETLSKLQSHELAEGIEKIKVKSNPEFIIKPVSAQARLKRDRSEKPLRTRNRPRLTCDLQWNEVTMSLNEYQYDSLVNSVRGLDDIAKLKKYKLLQPNESIKENPRAWWIYATRCHGLLKYVNTKNIVKDNIKYIKICTRLISNPSEVLNVEDKSFKDSFEKERSLEDLRELREICMVLIPLPSDVKSGNGNQGRSMLLHWFPGWLGWYGNTENPESPTSQSSTPSVTDSEYLDPQSTFEDEFLSALADSVETNSILKRDAVFGKFCFNLKKGSLDVYRGGFGTDLLQMIEFQFENLLLNVESRPRSASHFVSLSLGSILLKDHLTLNTEFPDIIKPQVKDELLQKAKIQRSRLTLSLTPVSPPPIVEENHEPLFQLEYEKKPLNYNTDYRLLLKSRSLDIVYNLDVIKWTLDFLSKPHLQGAKKKIEAMKNKTKMELKKNWEHIVEGRLSERKTWTLEIDVSAPQIIFAENLADRQGSIIVVVDFGRMQITNSAQTEIKDASQNNSKMNDMTNIASDNSIKDSEDDEMFMTPCSTPPGSEIDSPTMASTLSDTFQTPLTGNVYQKQISSAQDVTELNESNLFSRIYDRYSINLTDLQILVCKGRERWSYASSKGTSNLHVLDRFNISLQLERRIVATNDPQYPSFTLFGTLPKLNVHVNESKIGSIVNMLNIIYANHPESPSKSPADSPMAEKKIIEEIQSQEVLTEASKLILVQFTIDQMSLEVQSCGRSICELQVTGVKTGLTQRSTDTNITLSVHGLLLVDAIQSYGPDFELLVASHRHVGMDSLSGSLRQSEPCSPCSPGSPDPNTHIRPTSPLSLSRAISSLQRGKIFVT